MSMTVTPSAVAGNIAAASALLRTISVDLPAVRYGSAASSTPEPPILANASKAAQAVKDALVGFTWVMRDKADFSDGVWSDKAGQSDVAQAARLLDRSASVTAKLSSDLATIGADTTPGKAGTMPTYNDFGDGGTPLPAYWAPALQRTQADLAQALKVLDATPA